MLKVLHLLNYPGRGGTERYILSLAEKLHNKSCKFYLGYSKGGPMLEQARKLGIKAINIPMRSPYDFKAAAKVKEVCEKFSIDVIHTHFLRENYVSIFSRLAGNRTALVNTHHMLAEKNMLLRLSNRLLTRLDDKITAVSDAVRERMIREGISPSKIEVIYNGVDPDYWKGRRSMKVRKELGISESDFVIASVARFSEEKGHAFLLESVKQFKKLMASKTSPKAEKVKFLLVGDGELFSECRKFAELLGVSDDVIFMGYRSDIKTILYDSDLYVSHSKSEALGISILEALACGLPVVATSAGGPSEIVNEDSKCGVLVDYGDAEGFAAALLKFITDREFYVACKENAPATVRKKFNLDETAQQTYNLYNRCLELRRKGGDTA